MCISLGMLDGLQEVLSNDTGGNEQGSGAQVCWTEQRKESYHSLPGIVNIIDTNDTNEERQFEEGYHYSVDCRDAYKPPC